MDVTNLTIEDVAQACGQIQDDEDSIGKEYSIEHDKYNLADPAQQIKFAEWQIKKKKDIEQDLENQKKYFELQKQEYQAYKAKQEEKLEFLNTSLVALCKASVTNNKIVGYNFGTLYFKTTKSLKVEDEQEIIDIAEQEGFLDIVTKTKHLLSKTMLQAYLDNSPRQLPGVETVYKETAIIKGNK